MGLYSFQPMFVAPIEAGIKGGTIRAERGKIAMHQPTRPGGHARPGELLHLYCQVRSQRGFLIDRKTCVATERIALHFTEGGIIMLDGARLTLHRRESLDGFARFDGFSDFDDMAEFWRKTHGNKVDTPMGVPFRRSEHFVGWHIRWLPLPADLA